MSLLEDLQQATKEAAGDLPCSLCEYIATIEDPEVKELLTEGAAGKIGIHKLGAILFSHQTGIGERTIKRHRREGHQPA